MSRLWTENDNRDLAIVTSYQEQRIEALKAEVKRLERENAALHIVVEECLDIINGMDRKNENEHRDHNG